MKRGDWVENERKCGEGGIEGKKKKGGGVG